MPKLNMQQIRERARAIVAENPEGIRWAALLKQIGQEAGPETPSGTIHGAVLNLQDIYPSEISKPTRGLFKPANVDSDDPVIVGDTEQTAPTGLKIKESDFYESFAEWLKNDLDEVTDVAPFGGPA